MSRLSRGIKKAVSNPVQSIARGALGISTGGLSEALQKHPFGLASNPLAPGEIAPPYIDPNSDEGKLNALAAQEEEKRKALGLQQQGQINAFAEDQANRAGNYRNQLAKSLSDNAAATFKRLNPGILEDLNSRGLFTSQTARDTSQANVLGDLAREQNQQLSNFDTQNFNTLNDIRSSGLEAMLSGNQSALDQALALRKGAISRNFDVADQNSANAFAANLAKQQAKNQLIGSLIGAGGTVLGGFLGRK